MSKVRNYLSLIKFSHTIFAMPFALIGFFIAIRSGVVEYGTGQWNLNKSMDWGRTYSGVGSAEVWKILGLRLLLIILCMVFARSAAMAFNRYLDRHFDAKNPRTAIREIPAGIITAKNALMFTIVSSLLFIATCAFINTICLILAPVALAVILGYSYTKRFTPLCHLVLGLGLSLAPIGAFLAVTGVFHLLPVFFSIAVLCWVSGFDIIYALQDEEFDRSNHLYSIPAWLGKRKGLRVSEILHVVSAGAILFAGYHWHFGFLYWIGAVVFCGMLIYQHLIVKPDDLRRVNLAFMTANGVASVIFAAFVIADLFVYRPLPVVSLTVIF